MNSGTIKSVYIANIIRNTSYQLNFSDIKILINRRICIFNTDTTKNSLLNWIRHFL